MQNREVYRYRPTTNYGNRASFTRPHAEVAKRRRRWPALVVLLLVVIGGVSVVVLHTQAAAPVAGTAKTVTKAASSKPVMPKAVAAAAKPSVCVGNTISQLVIVSVTQRHMWACGADKQLYDSAVVTGDTQLASTLTPPGTYHIYAKQTNLHLTGSDANGSWDDPVSYWMPWLYNQYGAYGFHDATWRPADAFGNIDESTSNASHGCVELPLATAAWLYNWAQVGTTVTVEA